MADLISRVAALDAIDGMKPMQGNMDQLAMKALCWAAVKTIQPVDAVPVVRCKDCKYAQHDVMYHDIWCDGIIRQPEWYCADGKRRCNSEAD